LHQQERTPSGAAQPQQEPQWPASDHFPESAPVLSEFRRGLGLEMLVRYAKNNEHRIRSDS
jgi:hypothetical protein